MKFVPENTDDEVFVSLFHCCVSDVVCFLLETLAMPPKFFLWSNLYSQRACLKHEMAK